MAYTTTYELAVRYRKQVDAIAEKTKSQVDLSKKNHRKLMLDTLSKAYKTVQGRSRLTLVTEGCI